MRGILGNKTPWSEFEPKEVCLWLDFHSTRQYHTSYQGSQGFNKPDRRATPTNHDMVSTANMHRCALSYTYMPIVTNTCLIGFKPHFTGEILFLVWINYLAPRKLMRPWTTENNLLPPLCWASIISWYILNIVLIPIVLIGNIPQQRFSF